MTLVQQREEDIKGYRQILEDDITYLTDKHAQILQDFISNIYIKMAEENIERLKLLAQLYLMNTEWDMIKAIEIEITCWQEQLNKLK